MQAAAVHKEAGWLAPVLWLAAALAACLSVLALNGRPLFYLDIWLYVEQGTTALQLAGLIDRVPVMAADGGAAGPAGGAASTVNGSRSVVYAIITGLAVHFGTLSAVVWMNAVLILGTVALVMRVIRRVCWPQAPLAMLIAVPVLAASLGSLPFYVAYLMPDIFTPVLLLMIGLLAVFARQMRGWEIVLALALGSLAIVSHLSHLGIAALMVPVAVLASVLAGRRGWWLGPVLVLAILGVGYAQNKLFKVAAKELAHSEVILSPILTARMLQDGPGMAYLNRHCPDPAIDTCLLHAELQKSDDPYRITASHILFETSERLGSLKRMPVEEQQKVARAQFRFFFDVAREDPAGVAYAIVKNTLTQAQLIRVDMTIPSPKVVAAVADVPGLVGEARLADGWMTAQQGWLVPVTWVHRIYYVLSAAVVLVLLVQPGRVPGKVKIFALMLIAGILANAVVCGAVSQPAARYGARVIWLLPFAAALLGLFALFARREER